MNIRRLPGLAFAVALLVAAWNPAVVRGDKNQDAPRPQPDADTIALVQMVDASIVAQPTVSAADTTQGDLAIKWESAHFIKGQNGAYIPFTVSFDPSSIRSSNVALYIRAVEKGQLSATAVALTPAAAGSKPKNAPAPRKYAWDNVHFLPKPADGRITRAVALPAGEYELFVAVKERSPASQAVTATPPITAASRSGLLRHAVTAPDFATAGLQTSSVILATGVQSVSGQLSPSEQEANPYVFGPMRILPSRDGRFAKNAELQVLFWVYGATALAGGKPDVTIDFDFYVRQPDGSDKYFNKTKPQELNANTLPAEFNVAAGHQLPGSLIVGLMPFPLGDYRLEIKVTDKPSGKVVTQNVAFTVTG